MCACKYVRIRETIWEHNLVCGLTIRWHSVILDHWVPMTSFQDAHHKMLLFLTHSLLISYVFITSLRLYLSHFLVSLPPAISFSSLFSLLSASLPPSLLHHVTLLAEVWLASHPLVPYSNRSQPCESQWPLFIVKYDI